jgi:hypothetical protein
MNKAGIGSHTTPNQGATNTWLTPPHIVRALGAFDLDPCAAPSPRPWDTASRHIELPEDGLIASWGDPFSSRIWLNPPYGKETDAWLEKMSTHRNGIALIFARTETATWQTWVWPFAHSILFLDGRLFFHLPDGTRGKSNAGGPSALISYSHADTIEFRHSGLKGVLVTQTGRLR